MNPSSPKTNLTKFATTTITTTIKIANNMKKL
jgi:hypothetical protein